MRRFGEWEDIPLIVDAVQRPNGGSSSLLSPGTEVSTKYARAARVILAIGRGRLAELISNRLPALLLARIIVEASDREFRMLDDNSIDLLLHSEDESARKATALKCIRALSKRRVARILTSYIALGQTYYYNVVHWLDLSVSAPSGRARSAANKALTIAFARGS
jgi:hypothetical protein